MNIRWRHSGGLWLLVVLLALTGCGKKTRPVPPGDVMPAPITDLAYELDEKGVTLSWSLPARTVQGARLPYRLKEFMLYRAVVPAKEYCEGCPVPFGEPMEIPISEEAKGQVAYQESLLRPKHRYLYQVRSRAGWLLTSEPSNTVSLLWDTPPQEPEGFTITPDDRVLILQWQPPAGLLDGTVVRDPYQYQVYRSTDGETFAVHGESVAETRLLDKLVKNNERYYYKVRAIRLHDGTMASGLMSRVVSAVPRDMTPPAPPQQITTFQTPAGIKIAWDVVPEADLAGFRIYRRLPAQSKPARIGETGPEGLAFVDAAPPRGAQLWYYTVTVFDQAGNESAPALEAVFGKVE